MKFQLSIVPLLAFALLCECTTATAALVSNGDFELGAFAHPGDGNFNDFGSGATGTVILPGENILAGWSIFLSPSDPTNALDFVDPARGMEWVNSNNGFAFSGSRFVDLNRGEIGRGRDFFGITTTITTQPNSIYELTFAASFGGLLRVMATGSNLLLSSADAIPDDAIWRVYSHRFTANSTSTALTLQLEAAGADFGSGSFIDGVSVATIPEPVSLHLLFFLGAFCLHTRSFRANERNG